MRPKLERAMLLTRRRMLDGLCTCIHSPIQTVLYMRHEERHRIALEYTSYASLHHHQNNHIIYQPLEGGAKLLHLFVLDEAIP